MKMFRLVRDVDVSGVSGTGVVCEGIEFSDGTAVIHWVAGDVHSTCVYPRVVDVVAIHGHGGATRLVWDMGDDSGIAYPNVPAGSKAHKVVSDVPQFEGQTTIEEAIAP